MNKEMIQRVEDIAVERLADGSYMLKSVEGRKAIHTLVDAIEASQLPEELKKLAIENLGLGQALQAADNRIGELETALDAIADGRDEIWEDYPDDCEMKAWMDFAKTALKTDNK